MLYLIPKTLIILYFLKVFLDFFVILQRQLDNIAPKTEVTMDFQYRLDYSRLSDKQIVEKILAEPHDEEAAAYLLHNRYAPLLQKIYYRLTSEDEWFVDCVDELFIYLKGKDCSWNVLASFEWRSTFGYWLKRVAWHKLKDIIPKLIENGGSNIPLDNDNSFKPKVQVAVDGEKYYERRLQKVMLMEAIGKLMDDKQRFAILKRLEGYPSKDIAILFQIKWQKEGIVVYNNQKEVVVPDEDYVNVLIQRAKKELRKFMVEL